MKILVLMPLEEQSTYMAMGIYKNLPHEIKDITFCMPSFMDYLTSIKLARTWEYALFDAILSANNVYEATKENEDLIIIGNISKDYKFDAVFNFQDLIEDKKYQDNFLDKMREKVASEELLSKMVNNLYTSEDSKMALHNCLATADFLTAYVHSDPHLDVIKEEYEKRLQELKDITNGKCN